MVSESVQPSTIPVTRSPKTTQRRFPAALKPLPNLLTQVAVIAEDATRVVEFVGGADEPDRRRSFAEPFDVDPLSVFPRRFRNGLGVRTAFDNPGHALAETTQNLVPRLRTPLVLDGFVLVSAVFDYDRRDGEQMRNIRNARALPLLLSVELRSEHKGVLKTAGHWERHSAHYPTSHPVDNHSHLSAGSPLHCL